MRLPARSQATTGSPGPAQHSGKGTSKVPQQHAPTTNRCNLPGRCSVLLLTGPCMCAAVRNAAPMYCGRQQAGVPVASHPQTCGAHLWDPTPAAGRRCAAVCTGSGWRAKISASTGNCPSAAYLQYGPGGSWICLVTVTPPCAWTSTGSIASCSHPLLVDSCCGLPHTAVHHPAHVCSD